MHCCNAEVCTKEPWAYGNGVGEADARAKQILTVSMQGDVSVIPENRVLKVRFKDISDGKVSLYVDDQKVETDELLTDCAAIDVATQVEKKYRIEVEYVPQAQLEKVKSYACKTLICAKGNIVNKDDLWKQIERR